MHGSRTSAHEQGTAAQTRHSERRHTCPCASALLVRAASQHTRSTAHNWQPHPMSHSAPPPVMTSSRPVSLA
eukprot:2081356-Prymnesium_polylepis.1